MSRLFCLVLGIGARSLDGVGPERLKIDSTWLNFGTEFEVSIKSNEQNSMKFCTCKSCPLTHWRWSHWMHFSFGVFLSPSEASSLLPLEKKHIQEVRVTHFYLLLSCYGRPTRGNSAITSCLPAICARWPTDLKSWGVRLASTPSKL